MEGLCEGFLKIDLDVASDRIFVWDSQGKLFQLETGKKKSQLVYIRQIKKHKYRSLFFYRNNAFLLDIFGRLKIIPLFDVQPKLLPEIFKKCENTVSLGGESQFSRTVHFENENSKTVKFNVQLSKLENSHEINKKNLLEDDSIKKLSNDVKAVYVKKQIKINTLSCPKNLIQDRKMQHDIKQLFQNKGPSISEIMKSEFVSMKKLFNVHMVNFNKNSSLGYFRTPEFVGNFSKRSSLFYSSKEFQKQDDFQKPIIKLKANNQNNVIFIGNKHISAKKKQKISVNGDIILKIYQSYYLKSLFLLTSKGKLFKLISNDFQYYLTEIKLPNLEVYNICTNGTKVYLLTDSQNTPKSSCISKYLPFSLFSLINSHSKRTIQSINTRLSKTID